jgi:hypothetical protein
VFDEPAVITYLLPPTPTLDDDGPAVALGDRLASSG